MTSGPVGGQRWCLQNLGLLEGVTFSTTPPKAFGPKHGRVAGVVAVGLAFMLSMTPGSQRLSTLFTLQAGPMPVLAQRGYPLSCRADPPESLLGGRHIHPLYTPVPVRSLDSLHLAVCLSSSPCPFPKGNSSVPSANPNKPEGPLPRNLRGMTPWNWWGCWKWRGTPQLG